MWKITEFGNLLGVSASTLRRWEQEGRLIPERTLGNQRIYTESHLAAARSLKTGQYPDKVVIYCRVSSNNQKDDLLPPN
ncbi:MAG: MerR family DNA-binding transcriptional regulator [Calothrix sp. MO_192.B10]|nr:MerR family DNA-binding transcriptional regulator [Calothrix sp. MO_192.B10]